MFRHQIKGLIIQIYKVLFPTFTPSRKMTKQNVAEQNIKLLPKCNLTIFGLM